MLTGYETLREIGIQGLAGLLAGVALLALTYGVLEYWLNAKSRLERWRDDEQKVEAARRAVLQAVLEELKSNAGARVLAIETLKERRVSFPLFSTEVLAVAFDAQFFPAMSARTVNALIHVYSRMVSANRLHDQLFDMWRGPTSVMAGMAASAAIMEPKAREAYAAFADDRYHHMDAVLARCVNAAEHLFEAIESVEADLGVVGEPAASQRTFAVQVENVGP